MKASRACLRPQKPKKFRSWRENAQKAHMHAPFLCISALPLKKRQTRTLPPYFHSFSNRANIPLKFVNLHYLFLTFWGHNSRGQFGFWKIRVGISRTVESFLQVWTTPPESFGSGAKNQPPRKRGNGPMSQLKRWCKSMTAKLRAYKCMIHGGLVKLCYAKHALPIKRRYGERLRIQNTALPAALISGTEDDDEDLDT